MRNSFVRPFWASRRCTEFRSPCGRRSSRTRVRRQLIRELTGKVPADQIEERVAGLGNGDPVDLERALGYLNVRDAGRRLMTYPTAGEQLAIMVGTQSQLTAGEWANPGYVALTLLSKVRPERVPFIFYVVPDHSTPIDPAFDPQVSAY